MLNFEATSLSFPHVPARLPLGRRDPAWPARGEALAELAARIGDQFADLLPGGPAT